MKKDKILVENASVFLLGQSDTINKVIIDLDEEFQQKKFLNPITKNTWTIAHEI